MEGNGWVEKVAKLEAEVARLKDAMSWSETKAWDEVEILKEYIDRQKGELVRLCDAYTGAIDPSKILCELRIAEEKLIAKQEYIDRLQILILHHADFQGCRYYATDDDAWATEVKSIKEIRKYKEGA